MRPGCRAPARPSCRLSCPVTSDDFQAGPGVKGAPGPAVGSIRVPASIPARQPRTSRGPRTTAASPPHGPVLADHLPQSHSLKKPADAGDAASLPPRAQALPHSPSPQAPSSLHPWCTASPPEGRSLTCGPLLRGMATRALQYGGAAAPPGPPARPSCSGFTFLPAWHRAHSRRRRIAPEDTGIMQTVPPDRSSLRRRGGWRTPAAPAGAGRAPASVPPEHHGGHWPRIRRPTRRSWWRARWHNGIRSGGGGGSHARRSRPGSAPDTGRDARHRGGQCAGGSCGRADSCHWLICTRSGRGTGAVPGFSALRQCGPALQT